MSLDLAVVGWCCIPYPTGSARWWGPLISYTQHEMKNASPAALFTAVLVGHSDNVVRENCSSGRAGISLEKGHQQQQLERVHVYTLQCLLQATNHRFTIIHGVDTGIKLYQKEWAPDCFANRSEAGGEQIQVHLQVVAPFTKQAPRSRYACTAPN